MAGLLLFVQLPSGEKQAVEVPAAATVADVVAQVPTTEGRPPDLYLGDRLLPPAAALADEGVSAEAVLEARVRRGFQPGQRLEANDVQTPGYVCVATVAALREVDGRQQVRIHFDGWSSYYDYWADIDSPEIAVAGTVERMNYRLQAPKGEPWWGWDAYLSRVGGELAPGSAFAPRELDFPSLVKRSQWVYECNQGAVGEEYLRRPPPAPHDTADDRSIRELAELM
eukprot:TRINITY_DN26584_c0_g1_i1.p1 TRINITY_DN26584_c0_g1~~TRINITY_DN26584_c0_g1_i1.p1  ORF type:complete len:248 (+),score=55.49 TRINITY_DN26584_c0_g1_i1:67-744(+)